MGWLYQQEIKTVADLVKQLDTPNYKIIKYKSKGPNLWCAVEADGEKFVMLVLIDRSSVRTYGLGYKVITEDMGPVDYSCPIDLLELTAPGLNNGYAKEWRQKVRNYWTIL